jgi:hypothetical protein
MGITIDIHLHDSWSPEAREAATKARRAHSGPHGSGGPNGTRVHPGSAIKVTTATQPSQFHPNKHTAKLVHTHGSVQPAGTIAYHGGTAHPTKEQAHAEAMGIAQARGYKLVSPRGT